MKDDQEELKEIILQTVSLLCNNGLKYEKQLHIQGLLGISADEQVYIIQIDNIFSKDSRTDSHNNLKNAVNLEAYLQNKSSGSNNWPNKCIQSIETELNKNILSVAQTKNVENISNTHNEPKLIIRGQSSNESNLNNLGQSLNITDDYIDDNNTTYNEPNLNNRGQSSNEPDDYVDDNNTQKTINTFKTESEDDDLIFVKSEINLKFNEPTKEMEKDVINDNKNNNNICNLYSNSKNRYSNNSISTANNFDNCMSKENVSIHNLNPNLNKNNKPRQNNSYNNNDDDDDCFSEYYTDKTTNESRCIDESSVDMSTAVHRRFDKNYLSRLFNSDRKSLTDNLNKKNISNKIISPEKKYIPQANPDYLFFDDYNQSTVKEEEDRLQKPEKRNAQKTSNSRRKKNIDPTFHNRLNHQSEMRNRSSSWQWHQNISAVKELTFPENEDNNNNFDKEGIDNPMETIKFDSDNILDNFESGNWLENKGGNGWGEMGRVNNNWSLKERRNDSWGENGDELYSEDLKNKKNWKSKTVVCQYPGCGKTFCHSCHLYRHQRLKHGRRYGVVSQTSFTCQHAYCNKVFYRISSLENHVRRVHSQMD